MTRDISERGCTTPISLFAQPTETKTVSLRSSFCIASADMIPCASGFTKDTIPPISFMCSKHARTDACSIDVVTQCVYLAVEPPSIIFLKEPRMARLLDSVIPDVKIISRGLHPNSEAMRARELPSERDARTP